MQWSKATRAGVIYAGLVPFLVFLLFPFFWMVITSLKSNRELYDLNQIPIFIRQGATLTHYKLLIRDTRFGTWFANSLVVGLCATGISTVVSILAAYAIVRLRFRGSQLIGMGIFVTYLVPPTLLFLPLSRVVSLLGLGGFNLGTHRHLSDIPRPVLHLAPHGIFPDHPERDGGVRYGGRGNPVAGVDPHHSANGDPGSPDRSPLFLHPVLGPFHLRPGLRLHCHAEGPYRGYCH